MVKLIGAFSQLDVVHIAVIGDFMYDMYTMGRVNRISPEAPVSVLNVEREEGRPGGAGNVVLNLVSLGAKVKAIGRVGADEPGRNICAQLFGEGVDVSGMVIQESFETPFKNRFIADSQQILRVDFEKIQPVPEEVEQAIIEEFPSLFADIQVIAVSDYGKGFLSRSLLKALMEFAKGRHIPVIVDPKGDDFSKYRGATILKPNLQEAYEASKLSREVPLEQVASSIFKKVEIRQLMITRSEAGISLFTREGEGLHFPVRVKEVKDVTGAGDTVLSMLSVAVASGIEITSAVQLANIAAGIAIERLGCARINLSDMADRLLEFDIENKVFDERHLFTLQQAVKEKKYFVLGIESTQPMSKSLFQNIRKLSDKKGGKKLIIYVRDSSPDMEFVLFLASLSEIDFVVLKDESLRHLCQVIHPEEVFVIENDELISLDHFKALLREPA